MRSHLLVALTVTTVTVAFHMYPRPFAALVGCAALAGLLVGLGQRGRG